MSRLKKLGKRLDHRRRQRRSRQPDSAETKAAGELAIPRAKTTSGASVLNLQHNKVFVVDGPKGKTVACGSTNFSWRGFYVQNNNALVLRGATAVAAYHAAFEAYWHGPPKPSATRPRRTGRTSACRVSTPGSRSHRTPPRTPCSQPSPTTSTSTRPRRCSSRWRSSTRRPARFSPRSRT